MMKGMGLWEVHQGSPIWQPDEKEEPTFPIKPKGEVEELKVQNLRLTVKVGELQDERDYFEGLAARMEHQVATLEYQVKQLSYRLHSAAAQPQGTQPQGAMPTIIKSNLKFLIFACHPDRNPGRPEAAEITRELIALRGGK